MRLRLLALAMRLWPCAICHALKVWAAAPRAQGVFPTGNPKGTQRPRAKRPPGGYIAAMKYPYLLTLALGLDRFGAVVLFNRADICISSLCWVMLVSSRHLSATLAEAAVVQKALTSLNMYRWQEELLILIGRGLERLQPGHCQLSAQHDVLTSISTIDLLQA